MKLTEWIKDFVEQKSEREELESTLRKKYRDYFSQTSDMTDEYQFDLQYNILLMQRKIEDLERQINASKK